MKVSEKNKNLDLRRWGRNQYTKALNASESGEGGEGGSSSDALSSYDSFLRKMIYNTAELNAEDYSQDIRAEWSEEWIEENVILPDAIQLSTFVADVPVKGGERYTGSIKSLLVPKDTDLPMDMFVGNGVFVRAVYFKNTQIDTTKWYLTEYDGLVPGSMIESEEFQNYFPPRIKDGEFTWGDEESLADVYKSFVISDDSD